MGIVVAIRKPVDAPDEARVKCAGERRSKPFNEVKPWTEHELKGLLGRRLAAAIGPATLAYMVSALERLREFEARVSSDELDDPRSDESRQLTVQVREAAYLLRDTLNKLQICDERDQGERLSDYDRLISELDIHFPKPPVADAKGRPEEELTVSSPRVARRIQRMLQIAEVELSRDDYKKTIVAMVARCMDAKSATGAHGNGLTTRSMVRRALDKVHFFNGSE